MAEEEEKKAHSIAMVRKAIRTYVDDPQVWEDEQTRLFAGKVLWLLNEYEHNIVDDE